jgi:hypothetical protein
VSFGKGRSGSTTTNLAAALPQPSPIGWKSAHFSLVLPAADGNLLTITFQRGGLSLPACTAVVGFTPPSKAPRLTTGFLHVATFDPLLGQLITSLACAPGVISGYIEPQRVSITAENVAGSLIRTARDVIGALATYFGGYDYMSYDVAQTVPVRAWSPPGSTLR